MPRRLEMIRRLATVLVAIGLAVAPPAARRADAAFSLTPDTYPATEDTGLNVPAASGVLANDVKDGADLCIVTYGYVTSAHGNLVMDIDGGFLFQPDANFNGAAEWNYTAKPCGASDGEALQTTLTINVAAVNDAPTATADTFAALRNTTLNISAPGILGNDADVDTGETLTAVLDTTTVHGVLTLAANGSFSYTPQNGYVGPDSFSYHAYDGALSSSPPRVVKLTVDAIATPRPTAAPTAPPTVPPTEPPTPEPTVAPTAEPSPSASIEASPSPAASPSVNPSASAGVPSPVPSASAAPTPSDSGGVSTPILVVAVLFLFLLAFGLSVFVPRWLRSQRTGEPMDSP
jgi:hypothetical protein